MLIPSLKHGFAHLRANRRMVFVFYLANFLFGLILLLPFRAMLSNYIGDSQMGAKLGGALDMDFVFEFFGGNEAVLTTQRAMLLVVPGLYWLFGLFLSGGAFTIFATQERYTSQQFWSGAAAHFGRFVRLALYAVPLLGILFCVQFLETGVQRLVWGKDAYQSITYLGSWVRLAITALSVILFGMIFDYARVHTVLHEEHKMRVAIWQGIKFAFDNFLTTFGLGLFMFIAGALLLALYNPLANSFSASNMFIVLLLFLLQQFYVLARMALKLALYAGETFLYQQHAAATAPITSTPAQNLDLEGLAPALE
ncbi:hypothetical protein HUU05_16455 [candidate division KSB1 bacterium]|nr:hypothetical protein [candidate division KSB1 bacterium]